MPEHTCGPTANCVWRAAETLTLRGRLTRPQDLCIGISDEGEPCGNRAYRLIGAQPLCTSHLALITRVILLELQANDALTAQREAQHLALVRVETVRQSKLPKERNIGEVVYFARRGDTVKIGYSAEPNKRFRDLEHAAGIPFDEIITRRGGRAVEQKYHRRFQAHRTHGEWFVLVPEIRAEMDRWNVLRASSA